MADISNYIVQLLYKKECVIIPGLGAFITKYEPARIHATLHQISPPSRLVAFNKSIADNDGLLSQTVANKESLPYQVALKKIEEWVKVQWQLLDSGNEITLHGLGKIHLDIERNIQFLPENKLNFLEDSFGLKTITALPVAHIKKSKEIEHVIQHKPQKSITEKKSTTRWWAAAAIVLFFLTSATFLFFQQQKLNKKDSTDTAEILPIFDSTHSDNTPQAINSDSNNTVEMKENKAVELPEPSNEITAENNSLIDQKSVEHPDATNPSPKCYYIIIGAFQEQRNIHRNIQILKSIKGAEVITYKRGKLVLVGFKASENFGLAKEKLIIAQQSNPEYWLLRI